MKRLVVMLGALAAMGVGCNQPARMDPTPMANEATPPVATMQGTYVNMADNALLNLMTVNDAHFLPHRAMLSGLGRERVARLASLMEVYGGTVRLDTDCTDEDLVQRRIDTVIAALSEAGLDTTHSLVERDLPGGTQFGATEAILIKVTKGTFNPMKPSDSGISSLSRLGSQTGSGGSN